MKYWNILLPVSVPEDLYLPKLGMTVVSWWLRRPRWKGEWYSAWEVEASVGESALLRFWTAAAEARRAGRFCRAVWRTNEVAAFDGRDIALVLWCVRALNGLRVKEADAMMILPRESPSSSELTFLFLIGQISQ